MALDPENDETVAMGVPAPKSAVPSAQRFAPGTLLASRYRVVSRLGKGGMGEVFRADDIMLGQPVALKFLPEGAARNVNLLTRFYDEVRIARQISHANVCRVYDIGEIDGQPYLSMEYIDGEDLSSLLRRIGRLPGDKAAEFARKMCAGLAAAHAQGVLHRDIKPGNIMIDGRGEPRITDFGLAAVAASIEGSEIRNGTPAYMAPEQLEGREVSVQSDLYALGLVFHEMFTGKAAHEAETVAELTAKRKQSKTTKASTLVGDLDPAVDRAIQACLQPDPNLRPKSALELARMLPGGDPLAAALAAGQTPSPELVAASGSTGALSPKTGLAVFAATILALLVVAVVSPGFQSINKLPLENSPEVLAAKAREILAALGYPGPAADTAMGYPSGVPVLQYFRKNTKGPVDWDDVLSGSPNVVGFWYRESPRAFRPYPLTSGGRVTLTNPEMNVIGMTSLQIGLRGELLEFHAVPPAVVQKPEPAVVDWLRLFELARLDQNKFQPAEPQWAPLTPTDQRVAWTGVQRTTHKQPTDIPIRVEAASFAGRPVYFQIVYPWTVEPRQGAQDASPLGRAVVIALVLSFFGSILFGSLYLALHHLRTGSADGAGAVRVGAYLGAINLAGALLGAHFGDVPNEANALRDLMGMALVECAIFAVFYLTLEPWVRKSWPHVLITWSRVLQGHWIDPMVGRDVLFGVGIGALYSLVYQVLFETVVRGAGSLPSFGFQMRNVLGFQHVLSVLLGNLETGVVYTIGLLLLFFFLRLILRKQWLAATVLVLVMALNQTDSSSSRTLAVLALNVVIFGLLVGTIMRLGAVAAVMLIFVANSTTSSLLTTDYGAWYGTSSWVLLLVCAGIAFWGYRVAVAGQSLLDERNT